MWEIHTMSCVLQIMWTHWQYTFLLTWVTGWLLIQTKIFIMEINEQIAKFCAEEKRGKSSIKFVMLQVVLKVIHRAENQGSTYHFSTFCLFL